MEHVVVIGGGPAGLTTAYELKKLNKDIEVSVFEADKMVGGISRTESYNGFRIDIGGHRFFTKVGEVEEMWRDVLSTDFIRVPRMSRIYYKNRFFDYPLRIFNALSNIGAYESVRILLSYLKWQARPHPREENFEQWVMNRFGGRLYMHFFRSYTEKVWGIPPNQIRADWAAQRIKNLSLSKAVWNAISGANDTASLIEEFDYPRLGPGMMWERTAELIEKDGGKVTLNARVEKLERSGTRITAVEVSGSDGTHRVEADQFVNSMGLRELIQRIDPPPPQHVLDAAADLAYRDFLIVALVLNSPDPFPDNWIYVHSGDVKVGRIQNFRAWSAEMVPNDTQASIGMEYFCQQGDEFWDMKDEDLIAQASLELERIGLAKADMVVDAHIIRQPKAYPVYDTKYKDAVDVISEWINSLENLQTVGRNGLHRYNNQDHSMLTGMLAARNILGEDNDLWSVNVERSYHEEFQHEEKEEFEASKAS
ncbi:NAD(P)/FAD-dependent oxidoreductase [Roseobacter sp. YSTF-M11]|uniref:NAD(P)/FAD-dependent oxidoreductase n=1 Tax=Roseobacter insulae TaxID=2859783 RepID=A0A9X1FXV0_9RHOB|nr:NAD(P)/FAD-dependent oxidoreductase [Roseobacter insulae]MBW4708908.1 NAD(P)/FAD-dependent oxidoreductase [Roseobacter insulae]